MLTQELANMTSHNIDVWCHMLGSVNTNKSIYLPPCLILKPPCLILKPGNGVCCDGSGRTSQIPPVWRSVSVPIVLGLWCTRLGLPQGASAEYWWPRTAWASHVNHWMQANSIVKAILNINTHSSKLTSQHCVWLLWLRKKCTDPQRLLNKASKRPMCWNCIGI